MDNLLSCGFLINPDSLEFMFDKDISSNSPILSYSGGQFYFFEDESVFENFCSNFMNKPFCDMNNKNRVRELVGAYPCNLIFGGENFYSLSKSSRVDRSYENLRERFLDCIPINDTKLYFEGLSGAYVSSKYFK
jgi:hypothetical protein